MFISRSCLKELSSAALHLKFLYINLPAACVWGWVNLHKSESTNVQPHPWRLPTITCKKISIFSMLLFLLLDVTINILVLEKYVCSTKELERSLLEIARCYSSISNNISRRSFNGMSYMVHNFYNIYMQRMLMLR